MQLFIKCYLSKNFNNLGKHLHVKMKKEKNRKSHKLFITILFQPTRTKRLGRQQKLGL